MFSVEGVPPEIDLTRHIAYGLYDEDGNPTTLTAQQYFMSGITLATLEEMATRYPIQFAR